MKNTLNNIQTYISKHKKRLYLGMATYVAACLLSTGIEYITNQQIKKKFLETRSELLSEHTALSHKLRQILIQSDSAYFAVEKYTLDTYDLFGIGLPVISLITSKADMTKASLEYSREYIKEIIKQHNIKTLNDFHTYMQTIKYKYYTEQENRPFPPAITASRKEGDCDDKTLLGVLILQELGYGTGKVDVTFNKTGKGHAFIVIELDLKNPEHISFIVTNGLERKVHLRENNPDKAIIFYEPTIEDKEFRQVCLTKERVDSNFTMIDWTNGGSSFRVPSK